MRNHLVIALVMALMTTGVFALDLGGGLTLTTHTVQYVSVEGGVSMEEISGVGFGVFAFLGWKYMDINVGASYNSIPMPDDGDFFWIGLFFGLYLKLPITISPSLRIYPIIGADSDRVLYFRGGAGADVILRKNMYLRGNILYGLYYSYGFTHGFLFKLGLGWVL